MENQQKESEALINLLIARGIKSDAVLNAIRATPRHLFVKPEYRIMAYADQPLSIDYRQVITQPYLVALMTEALLSGPKVMNKVLEIGTGSGYQAAVLAKLVNEVYTIERIKPLSTEAKARLENSHLDNVHVRYGDGNKGWPEHAPYDGIIVTAATDKIPPIYLEQLAEGGKLVIPPYSLLQSEMSHLQRKYTGDKGYKIYPRKTGDVTSDDVCDALAGACYNAINAHANRLPMGRLVDTGSYNQSNSTVWRSMQGTPYGVGSGASVARQMEQRSQIPGYRRS